MQLIGHSDAKYRTGNRLGSSAFTRWDSILVERWHHAEGRINDTKPRDTEIAILTSGRCRVRRIGDGEAQDHHGVPGTAWLCPSGIQERDIDIVGTMEEVVHIFIPAEPFSKSALEDYDIDPARLHLGYFGGLQDPFITQVAYALRQELLAADPAGSLLVDTLRVSMAAYLVRHYSNFEKNRMALPSANGALDKQRMQRVADYIEANIERNISLEELANVACLSTFHFARAFKAANGASPHSYVTARKIAYSKRLIEHAPDDLSVIALKSGFSSQAHFSRAFKRATGMTPGKYRGERTTKQGL
jgi:AraC family transcriptional regulator